MRPRRVLLAILLTLQGLAGCSWVNNEPMEFKVPGPTGQTTPCIASAMGKEFHDIIPVIGRGNVPGGTEITVEAPRGGLLAFVTVDPLPSGDSHVTVYQGNLYWPNHVTSGVFPDVARDNWHRAERAILQCNAKAA
jgi:hypothetical protein